MRRVLAFILIAALFVFSIGPMPVSAQGLELPLSKIIFPPSLAMVKGLTVHPDNPLQFDLIVEPNNVGAGLSGPSQLGGSTPPLRDEYMKLIKYFLASVTTPETDMWVNLSPYEKNRIIPDGFGQTLMGRDLLVDDYILKQVTASLIHPESQVGKQFWSKVYAQAQAKYGTTNVPINTFNKVWIMPDKATVWEHGQSVFVVERHLKVMLEEDYLSKEKHAMEPQNGLGISAWAPPPGVDPPSQKHPSHSVETNAVGSQIVREIVIPALEKEVNEGETFAQLRQIYNAMILATWFKKRMKDSLLGKIYMDQNKVRGVKYANSVIASKAKQSFNLNKIATSPLAPRNDTEAIYQQYLQTFKKGVFNLIKEEPDPSTGEMIPRQYFSGGAVGLKMAGLAMINSPIGRLPMEARAMLPGDQAMNVRFNLRTSSLPELSTPVSSLGDRAMVSAMDSLTEEEKGFVESTFGSKAQEALSMLGPQAFHQNRRVLLNRLIQKQLSLEIIADVMHYRSLEFGQSFEEMPEMLQEVILENLKSSRSISRLAFDNLLRLYEKKAGNSSDELKKEVSEMIKTSTEWSQKMNRPVFSPFRTYSQKEKEYEQVLGLDSILKDDPNAYKYEVRLSEEDGEQSFEIWTKDPDLIKAALVNTKDVSKSKFSGQGIPLGEVRYQPHEQGKNEIIFVQSWIRPNDTPLPDELKNMEKTLLKSFELYQQKQGQKQITTQAGYHYFLKNFLHRNTISRINRLYLDQGYSLINLGSRGWLWSKELSVTSKADMAMQAFHAEDLVSYVDNINEASYILLGSIEKSQKIPEIITFLKEHFSAHQGVIQGVDLGAGKEEWFRPNLMKLAKTADFRLSMEATDIDNPQLISNEDFERRHGLASIDFVSINAPEYLKKTIYDANRLLKKDGLIYLSSDLNELGVSFLLSLGYYVVWIPRFKDQDKIGVTQYVQPEGVVLASRVLSKAFESLSKGGLKIVKMKSQEEQLKRYARFSDSDLQEIEGKLPLIKDKAMQAVEFKPFVQMEKIWRENSPMRQQGWWIAFDVDQLTGVDPKTAGDAVKALNTILVNVLGANQVAQFFGGNNVGLRADKEEGYIYLSADINNEHLSELLNGIRDRFKVISGKTVSMTAVASSGFKGDFERLTNLLDLMLDEVKGNPDQLASSDYGDKVLIYDPKNNNYDEVLNARQKAKENGSLITRENIKNELGALREHMENDPFSFSFEISLLPEEVNKDFLDLYQHFIQEYLSFTKSIPLKWQRSNEDVLWDKFSQWSQKMKQERLPQRLDQEFEQLLGKIDTESKRVIRFESMKQAYQSFSRSLSVALGDQAVIAQAKEKIGDNAMRASALSGSSKQRLIVRLSNNEKVRIIAQVMERNDQDMKDYLKSVPLKTGLDYRYAPTDIEYGQKVIASLKEKGFMSSGKRFSDIGAGTGIMLALAAALTDVKEAVGIEPDPVLMEFGKKAMDELHRLGVLDKNRIKWISSKWQDIPDVIESLDVAYFFSSSENAASDIKKHMRKDAYLATILNRSGWGEKESKIGSQKTGEQQAGMHASALSESSKQRPSLRPSNGRSFDDIVRNFEWGEFQDPRDFKPENKLEEQYFEELASADNEGLREVFERMVFRHVRIKAHETQPLMLLLDQVDRGPASLQQFIDHLADPNGRQREWQNDFVNFMLGYRMLKNQSMRTIFKSEGTLDKLDQGYAMGKAFLHELSLRLSIDNAMQVDANVKNPGGIDMNSNNLELSIKRDGSGALLPASFQNWSNIRIDGLEPIIINIEPFDSASLFSYN